MCIRDRKAQAAEVARVAQELADRARFWLERAAERLSPEQGLSHAGGVGRGDGANDRQDLATRLRAAWEARQGQREDKPDRDQALEPAHSLAEQMREAARGIDREALAGRAAGLQQDRQAEERQRVQEVERLKEQERLREREERYHDRDDGLSH